MAELALKTADAGAAGFYRAARICFLLLLCVMPMEAVTAVREIALAASALFLGVALFLGGDRRFRPTVLALPWLLYLAVALASVFTAADPAYSLSELRAEVIKGALAFYLAAHILREPKHLEQVWLAILAGLALMSMAGLAFFFLYGGNPFSYQVRADSFSAGFPEFGTYLVTVWPFALLGYRAAGKKWQRRALDGLVVLTLAAAYVTFGRATWGAMLLETALAGLLLSRHRLRSALAVGAVALVMALVLSTLPGARHGETWARLLSDPEKVGGTAGDLLDVWSYSLDRIAERPFRGIGLGRHSFNKAFPDFKESHQPLLWHAHNMFLDAALQMGLQGLFAILLMVVLLLASLWPKAPPAEGDLAGCFRLAAFAMVAGFCLRNFSDDLFADEASLLFWTLSGLALSAGVAFSNKMK